MPATYGDYPVELLNPMLERGEIQLGDPSDPIVWINPQGQPVTRSQMPGVVAALAPAVGGFVPAGGTQSLTLDDLSRTSSNIQQQGDALAQQRAQEAIARYNSTYHATGGFNLSKPGASELAYQNYSGQLAAPGAVENYANNAGQNYQNAQNSSASWSAFQNIAPTLQQQSPGETFAYSSSPNAGQATDTYNQTRGSIEGGSRIGSFAGTGPQLGGRDTAQQTQGLVQGSNLSGVAAQAPTNIDDARGHTSSASMQATTSGAVSGASRSQQYAQSHDYGLDTRSTASGQALAGSSGLINQLDPQATRAAAVAQNQAGYGQAAAKTAAANNYVINQPQLQQRSAAERLNGSDAINTATGQTAAGQYNQGLQGQNPVVPRDMSAYYDRQRELAQAGIDRAMAARGGYKSSSALDQSREALVDIGAQQAKAEADYGIQSALARNTILGGAAQAADASGMDRYRAQIQGALASDQSQINRLGLTGTQAAQADDATLGLYNTQLNNAVAADQLALQRGALDINKFNALNGAANNVDQSAINLGRLGLDISGQADTTGLARYVAQNNVANNADAASLGLANYGLNAANLADQNALGRYTAINNVAQGNDQNSIGAYTAQGNLLNAADTLDVNRFIANNSAANNASRTNIDAYTAQANATNAADRVGLARNQLTLDAARSADQSALGIYGAGLDTASASDAALRSRLGLLGQGAQAADANALNRASAYYASLAGLTGLGLDVSGAGYNGLLGTDDSYFLNGVEAGYGAGAQGVNGAMTNQAVTAANGATIVNTGSGVDATNRSILTNPSTFRKAK